MSPLINFLVNLFVRAPLEFLIALVRLLLFLLLFIPILLLKLWRWIHWLLHTKSLYDEETEEDCGRLPEVLVRRPDPCIYSQKLLMSQGLPVTWNNPDIWVAPASDPGAIEPDSYHLQDDTDYIVSVQAHNAATDAAIGVKVRLVYRPWSFNSPDLVPVETDPAGNEVFRYANISPMGSEIVQFLWHTPKLEAGEQKHYCLQVMLSHPEDINPANNIGQENTNVYSQNPGFVTPGEEAEVEIPLFGTGRQPQEVHFRWDTYEINQDDEVTLTLKTTQGKGRMSVADRLAHALPAFQGGRPETGQYLVTEPGASKSSKKSTRPLIGRLNFGTPKSRYEIHKTRYTDFEPYREKLLARDYSLPQGMDVTIDTLPEGMIEIAPEDVAMLKFRIKVPDDAHAGTKLPLNIIAETAAGVPAGGVTLYFQVKEGGG